MDGRRPVEIADDFGVTRARIGQIIDDLCGLDLVRRYGFREYAVTQEGLEALRRP